MLLQNVSTGPSSAIIFPIGLARSLGLQTLLCAISVAALQSNIAQSDPSAVAVVAGVAVQSDTQNFYVVDEVTVFGRGENLIGSAAAASEGAVAGDNLLVRPMLRVADLLEAVPAMIAAQHSGSGKANQYFLRGFNLDHGTDFTTYIDDVPWNLRTHGHGQGYLDVNGLIPESVERIDYRKGTYSALTGDFSMAGSAQMTSISGLHKPFIALENGSYGWGRVAGGGSADVGAGKLTLIGQYKTYDGPWELPEDLQHQSLWGKYAEKTDYGTWQISLSGYRASWHPTEQTPESAFGTTACKNQFCSLDPSAYGETNRWILTSNWLGESWRATLYGQFYDWHMLSNPTYTADGQINQFDKRNTVGGRYENSLIKRESFTVLVGSELRYDQIGKVGLDATEQGRHVANNSNNTVDEASLAVYSEAIWRPLESLRLTAGLRSDLYDFDVGVNPNSGSRDSNGRDSTLR